VLEVNAAIALAMFITTAALAVLVSNVETEQTAPQPAE
jgi:hypothetical protein